MKITAISNLKIVNRSYTIKGIKGFLNSIPDLGKCSFSIQILQDWHENLLSS